MTPEDRFLNLAGIEIGEALTLMNNLRQRGAAPGNDYLPAVDKLRRAASALIGTIYDPPVAEEHQNG